MKKEVLDRAGNVKEGEKLAMLPIYIETFSPDMHRVVDVLMI
jgi:hypothetical protein